jgi:hypothetical protein
MPQNPVGIGFDRSINLTATREAFSHLRMQARMERTNPAPGQIGEIARMNDRLTSEAWKEQAKQFDACAVSSRS